MNKVLCADCACKYWNNDKCTAKCVKLGYASVMTVHDGRQEFLRCRTREISEAYKDIMAIFENAEFMTRLIKPDE